MKALKNAISTINCDELNKARVKKGFIMPQSLVFLILSAVLAMFVGCQTSSSHSGSSSSSNGRIDPKYSLTKDRSELAELRKDIPEETQRTNDEKALLNEWMSDFRYAPEQVRDKFNNLVRKKRELFNKDLTKQRDSFSKEEKKAREDFLEQLKEDREQFLTRKTDSQKKQDFFYEQDTDRRDYFSNQRERRDEFESDQREKRKDFEDYVKEKTDEFNFELKDYTVKYKQYQDQKQQN